MGNMDDASKLAIADCYLQDCAATWMMSLEDAGNKPETALALQEAMIKGFVPPEEQARAETRLMKLKLAKSVDAYMSLFRDLIEICQTPLSEAYFFFFLSGLSDEHKEEFTNKYPMGAATSMQDVYELEHSIEMAMQWHTKPNRHAYHRSTRTTDGTQTTRRQEKRGTVTRSTSSNNSLSNNSTANRDKDVLSCGPAQTRERTLYRRIARCDDCGAKYTPAHVCEGQQQRGNEGEGSAGTYPNA